MFKRKFRLKIINGEKSLPLRGAIVGALELLPTSSIDDHSVGQIIYRLDDPRDLRLLANLLESWKGFVDISSE